MKTLGQQDNQTIIKEIGGKNILRGLGIVTLLGIALFYSFKWLNGGKTDFSAKSGSDNEFSGEEMIL